MSDRVVARNLDVLDLVQESVVVFDLDGRIKTWNAASERLYGWARDEVIGGLLKDTVRCSPSKPDGFFQTELPKTDRWEGELTRFVKSGDKVVVISKWSLRRDENGMPLDVVETSVDVTAERRTEEALKRAEYRYYNLFQAMAASFWELDFSAVGAMVREVMKSGVTDMAAYFAANPGFVRAMISATRILDVNDQTVALFGRGDKQELLPDLGRFWPDESVPVFAASVAAAISGRPHYSAETRFRTLDGREFDTLFTACFPPEMLNRGKLLVGVIDVSATKMAKIALENSERRYRNLFSFMPISLWQLDSRGVTALLAALQAEGVEDLPAYIDAHPDFVERAMSALQVIEVNRRTIELTGAQTAEELRGPVNRFWRLNPDPFRRSIEARFRGQSRYEEEIKFETLDGRVIDVLFVAAFPAALNETAISLVSLIDISDRVNAQEALAQVQAEFAHAARVSMLGELTASIAHEINQPLGAIATNGEASLRWIDRAEPDITEVRALTVRTVADARRAADIIRRIRGMAAPTVPEQTSIALNTMIEEAVLFLRHELQRQGVEAVLDLAAGLPGLVGDRVQLQQVLVNLAVNAMQAMAQAQSRERRLTFRTLLAEPRALRVEIEDTGPGIEAENLDRLFESFFTTKHTGMGIGLAICRTIIEAHGGRIAAANLPGGGARFAFTLPV